MLGRDNKGIQVGQSLADAAAAELGTGCCGLVALTNAVWAIHPLLILSQQYVLPCRDSSTGKLSPVPAERLFLH